jgi:hypothetical protein
MNEILVRTHIFTCKAYDYNIKIIIFLFNKVFEYNKLFLIFKLFHKCFKSKIGA